MTDARRQRVLAQVALLHLGLVLLLTAVVALVGWPVKGVLLGGGAMAVSLALLWAIGCALLVSARRSAIAMLGSLKILVYLGIASAVLSGRLVADGAGFAAGVGCFLVATVIVALGVSPAGQTSD